MAKGAFTCRGCSRKFLAQTHDAWNGTTQKFKCSQHGEFCSDCIDKSILNWKCPKCGKKAVEFEFKKVYEKWYRVWMSRYIPKVVKDVVRERDGNRCRVCGSRDYLEFDHMTPYSKGAPAIVENIQILCRLCNSKKRDRTKKCPKCSGWIPYDATYCQSCGRTVPRKIRNAGIVEHSGGWSLANYLGLFILIAIGLYLAAKYFT